MTEEKVFFETKEEHDYQSKEEGWQSLNEELWKRFQEDEGIIRYTLTNDYMFRVFLQENEFILRSLVGALLHLEQEEIVEINILNPIEVGVAITNKEFVLDTRILLNSNAYLNLEMQVNNNGNWTDRSLLYLCRSYDNLEKGGEYEEVFPAIHVGILDYTLFPEEPEFYATHKLMNVKTHKVYNDKFVLHVLSLKQIKRATEEDKEWHLDKWAALFAAKTWREIKMMAEKNEVLMRAGCELYKMNADDRIREQCQAREDYERHERAVKRQIRELEQALAEKENEMAEQATMLAQKDNEIATQAIELEQQASELAKKDNEIARLRKMLEEQMNS